MNTKKMLTNFIQQVLPMADDTVIEIAANFELFAFNKNDFLLKQGQTSNNYLLLEAGLLGHYLRRCRKRSDDKHLQQNSIVFEAASFLKKLQPRKIFKH